jgi:shikimate kinase
MMFSNHRVQQKTTHPLMVELVGVAGTGKTTLLRALSQRDDKIRVETDLEFRNRGHIPIFARYLPFLLAITLRGSRSSRLLNLDEMKALVYLKTWPDALRAEALRGSKAILLNHGPIFKLATLHAFGPESLKQQGLQRWWQRVFEQWARTLDIIVWLNAPDSVLVERINGRDQRHAVKGKPEREATQFLHRYQASYEQMVAQLTDNGGPKVLRFDTSRASVEQIVNEVLLAFHSKPGGTSTIELSA